MHPGARPRGFPTRRLVVPHSFGSRRLFFRWRMLKVLGNSVGRPTAPIKALTTHIKSTSASSVFSGISLSAPPPYETLRIVEGSLLPTILPSIERSATIQTYHHTSTKKAARMYRNPSECHPVHAPTSLACCGPPETYRVLSRRWRSSTRHTRKELLLTAPFPLPPPPHRAASPSCASKPPPLHPSFFTFFLLACRCVHTRTQGEAQSARYVGECRRRVGGSLFFSVSLPVSPSSGEQAARAGPQRVWRLKIR